MNRPFAKNRLQYRAGWLLTVPAFAGWAFGVLLLAAIAALSLLPLSGPTLDVPNADKLHHALAYVCMTLYFGQLTTVPRMFGLLLGYGIGIELLQAQMPPRQAELADLLANLVGIGIGVALLRTRLGNALTFT